MKKFLTILFLLLPTVASAQLGTVPYTFTPGTTIVSSEVNTNFSTAYATALNRTGGTMTGTLTSQALIPSADATYDLGSGSFRFRDGFLSRDLSVADDLTVTDTVTIGNGLTVTAGGLTVTAGNVLVSSGNLTLSSGNVSITGTLTASGTITGGTFSGSGASLTSIPETAITDGSILARVGAAETISARWTFSDHPWISSTAPFLNFSETDQGADLKKWAWGVDAGLFQLITLNDAESGISSVFRVDRSGNTITTGTIQASGGITSTGAGTFFHNSAPAALVVLSESDQAVGGKVWAFAADGGALALCKNAAGDSVGCDTNLFTVSRSTGSVSLSQSTGVFTERNRAFSMGATQTRAFSAGNFTGTGITWTVESGDVEGESWSVIGDTMYYRLSLITTTVSGTGATMNVLIPGSFTAAETVRSLGLIIDGAGPTGFIPQCKVTASSTTLTITYPNGANHATGTNNQSVSCQIVFKVS